MKRSLIEIVQEILSDMVSDQVNSIDDTEEAAQVASIVRSTYFEMIGNRNWPHLRKLIRLDAALDTTKPNYLKVPENVKEIAGFNYEAVNVNSGEVVPKDVKYKTPEEFMVYINNRNRTNANIEIVEDFSGVKLAIFNNAAPSFYTSFDDVYVVTDSYQVDYDTTLQSNKSQCVAYVNPTWVNNDDYIPDLPIEAFPALIEEAKSVAFFVIKQMVNQKAEQKASRQQRWLSRKAWKVHGGVEYPNYGRRGRR
jgi:hypothetical protein